MKLRIVKHWISAALIGGMLLPAIARADTVADLLRQYEDSGARQFSAGDALAFWSKPNVDAKSGETRRCSDCHGNDLRRAGKHVTTGKRIEPMAPSVNPQRLADREKIEKWFARNCRWTLGRDCTPQEKGNVLVMFRAQ